ncbi:FAD-NAD(P)-binding [Friedmanniella luteola]|uniref:FAD-NAD(P)-binding n=1 Tax=Friedmanniella luteola TaxID=546871 RepID=A0A1H1WIT1_9ACTN|nr:FAD/NAD(P)-binding protein [Friedmanniella luteola]SDS97005.1 FAD-NAD(P)-binding [Friedmanniella luteola]
MVEPEDDGTGTAGAASLVLVLVGLGPRGAGLLERLVSNAAVLDRGPVEVHLVDPFPPGPGRVWRDDQSELLRLNTTAEDLTAFVDASVTMDGPVTSGPTLFAWCRSEGAELPDAALVAEAAALGPLDFPSRRLASAYLAAAFDRAVARAPAGMTITSHAQRAVDVVRSDAGGRDRVVLDDGATLLADAVVLLTSHVDVAPAPPYAALAAFADDHGLTYLPPAYGGDLDLGPVGAGEDVLVRGFGLGFVDLMILLTEGRGGKFLTDPTDDDGARLRYEPSGAEPRLLVGSRRGVPYHAKPMYRLQAPRPAATTFCTPGAVTALLEQGRPITFLRDLWPLVGREVTWAYYLELAQGHPGRVRVPWPQFAATFADLEWGSAGYAQWIATVVPDPADRLDLAALDRPLRDRQVADRAELARLVRSYVRADLARRQDVAFSADLGAFHALLAVLPVLGPALASPQMDPRSLVQEFLGWFMGFFSFYASGPPPDRLEQLLALEEAGVVAFLGGGLEISTDPDRGAFVARSTTVPGEVRARTLVDATLPAFDLGRTEDPLLAALAARGEAVGQVLTAADGERLETGQLAVDPAHRLRRADGSSASRRFALGMHTTVKSAAFARPASNGPVHRHNDQVARTLLALAPLPDPPPIDDPTAAPGGPGGQ